MTETEPAVEVEVVNLEDLARDKNKRKQLQHELDLRKSLSETEEQELSTELKRLGYEQITRKHRFAGRDESDGYFDFSCVVTDSSVDFWAAKIEAFVYAHLDDEDKPGITFVINSPGGDVMAGWKLFDTLRSASAAGHHVTTHVRGEAASMGAVLAQAGDTRLMGPQSWMMIHEPSAGSFGKSSEIKDMAAFINRINEQIAGVFADRSGSTSKAKVKSLINRTDAWLTASDALRHGFVDEVK